MIFRASRILREAAKTAAHDLYPSFWNNPFRYLRWAAHEKPTFFFSTMLGLMGPVALVVIPPVRRYYGHVDRPLIPQTYPMPQGPRKIPEGYDDE